MSGLPAMHELFRPLRRQKQMSYELPLGRRLLKRWVTIIVVWWVFALGAVANKTILDLGPEWCAQYMLIKYMLYMKDGSCSSFATEPTRIRIQPSSQVGKALSQTLRIHFETLKLLDL